MVQKLLVRNLAEKQIVVSTCLENTEVSVEQNVLAMSAEGMGLT